MDESATPHSRVSHSRRVLIGFAAMSGSSFAVMGVQVGYAAITSRLLPPSAFGAYAVALSGVGFIGMLSGSSLGQSAARRDFDSVYLDRSLLTLALAVGCFMALVAILLAPLWGSLWGVPESTQVTRVLALGIPFSALSSVLAGVLRREGRTSVVAGRTALGQLSGVAVGLMAVLSLRTPWSLGVAVVVGGTGTAALLAAALPREHLKPARPTWASIEDVVYGVKSAGMDLLRYGTNLVPAWSISRYTGPLGLGAYNRATTLLTIPLETIQRAFSYSIFPELRPGGAADRSPRALTDVMILLTWPAIVVAGLGYFAAEPLILLLLGPGWEAAGSIAGLAVLIGVAPLLRVPIGTALEARGLFRTTAVGWLVGAVAMAIGVMGTAITGEMKFAMVGILGASLGATAVYCFAHHRGGRLQIRGLLRGTKAVIGIQAATSGFLLISTQDMQNYNVLLLAYVAFVGVAEVGLLWLIRRRTAFWDVAKRRGLVV